MKLLLVSIILMGKRYSGFVYSDKNTATWEQLCQVCPALNLAPRGTTYSIS